MVPILTNKKLLLEMLPFNSVAIRGIETTNILFVML